MEEDIKRWTARRQAALVPDILEPQADLASVLPKPLDQWAWENGVQLDFTRPGKPTDNGLCESFNGRLRDECLNVHEFTSIDEARQHIEAWRIDYNEHRPHSSLSHLTPSEFVEAGRKRSKEAAAF